MPARLPIFPLSAVLFPGTPLPLHIFEPRYQQMLADCLAGERKFGITPPGAAGEVPDAGTVGCIAEIRVHQDLPDGRATIVVVGGQRFVVVRVLEEAVPYHVALVETFDEQPATAPPDDELTRLRQQFQRYYALLRQLNDIGPDEPTLPDVPLELSFHVAAAVECDPGVKQRLLAERSTARRIGALLLLLPILTSAVESALRVHRCAPTNGQGSGHPDLLAGT
ncbi:MAG: LON peptidase substrate-binding domain-containing protein [Gemmatimonadota bacterium]|nr:LON peptidase substrate-binding domain-containing protein [Gemmatimonadota bacterium]